jgi:hypothetical protein
MTEKWFVKALDGKKVCCVKGGVHHSLVLTSSGAIEFIQNVSKYIHT